MHVRVREEERGMEEICTYERERERERGASFAETRIAIKRGALLESLIMGVEIELYDYSLSTL